MRLKLTLARPKGAAIDIAIVVEPTVTVGYLAQVVARRDPQAGPGPAPGPLTLAHLTSAGPGEPILAELSLVEAGIRSGAAVQVVPDTNPGTTAGGGRGPTLALVRVVEGPDAGREFELPLGTAYLGRGSSCDIRLNDPLVSKQHAKLHVSSVAELVDTNSSNGILVDGELTARVVMGSETVAVLGDTAIAVSMLGTPSGDATTQGAVVGFNRSPRIDPLYEGLDVVTPEIPRPEPAQRLPVAPLIIPVIMAGALYAITKSVISIAFVALTPLMFLGNFVERRSTRRRDALHQQEVFDSGMAALEQRLTGAAEAERAVRAAERPSIAELLPAVDALQPLTWTRQPAAPGFLEVRLGLGPMPSRTQVKVPDGQVHGPMLDRAFELRERFASVMPVPVVADLAEGALGLAGEGELAAEVARALLAQVVALHSPAEVVVAAVASASSAPGWDWLKWTPHVSSPSSPLASAHLAVGQGACLSLVAEIEDLIEARVEADPSAHLPAVVLLVEDDAAVERSRIADIARRGPAAGVSVVWRAPTVERLPAACRTYVQTDSSAGWARAIFVDDRNPVALGHVERLQPNAAMHLARRLAPLVDIGARTDDASDLPSAVSFVTLAGSELAASPQAVLERWTETGSIMDRQSAVRRRTKESGLRAMIGQSASEPFHVDLRAHGPHALVGGTTGAGKSELLQSWILGMATAYSPDRVTFLLVDYKGGSAFGQCRELPHTVGMVTDLSIQLARRALTSLVAELKYREHVLSRKRAKDLIELERSGDPEAPPSLVIVIDEFAALVQELPEFVDGVVNVAQRGRSLGLHLILATQRPAGVVKDNLRANTNLRLALRMADEADSTDVLGTPVAAGFDPALPGRAMAKLGPGRLVPFQSAYVGGTTADDPPPPAISVEELAFGPPRPWEEPEGVESALLGTQSTGPTDIQRLVQTIREAAAVGSIPDPRLPWLEELAPVYNLRHLTTARQDSELVFGVKDDPQHQAQPVASFLPDRDGNMIVYGTGGSGKSTTLRTMAIAAGLSIRGGPCQVYGIDAGSRGLSLIEDLPHVGSILDGDDTELVARLLQDLRSTIDERAERYAKVKAGSISEYRTLADRPDEARIFLLVDGIGPFRQSCDSGERSALFDTFVSLAVDGRPVGVHVLGTADRPSAVPSALASTMQHRLVLRLGGENDLVMLSIAKDAFTADTPPGRGYQDGSEVQVAVFGGSTNVADQAAAVGRLAITMRRNSVAEAPKVERLPEWVALSSLPVEADGMPVIGLSSTTLGPMAFRPRGGFIVSGPPGSGRTSALQTLALAVHRWRPDAQMVYVASASGGMRDLLPWNAMALGVDEIVEVAKTQAVRILNTGSGSGPLAVVIEGIGELLNTPADTALQELVKAAIAAGHVVMAEGDPSVFGGSSPLLQALKSSRFGIALQPEQLEGAMVFKTNFPRVTRAQFPVGRGLFVSGGRSGIIQLAVPE
jgi:S-DNA-T family DNA segregation ATPase FtsK/SpoIIIE